MSATPERVERVNILDQIVAVKRQEVARLRTREPEVRRQAAARRDYRDFAAALRSGGPGRPSLLAEIKKASPSAGLIRADFDPVRLAREYERAGATALSVLTDETFFQGRLEFLAQVRAAVRLPLLRKDFTIDAVQVYEAAASGADAILLIVALLEDRPLRELGALARQLHLAALVEVHDELELDRALGAGAEMIGINNRDLRDFTVHLETTERLAARLHATTKQRPRIADPASRITLVAESGLHTRADVERVAGAGVDAILVGESLMRSGDIVGKVKELLGR